MRSNPFLTFKISYFRLKASADQKHAFLTFDISYFCVTTVPSKVDETSFERGVDDIHQSRSNFKMAAVKDNEQI